MRASATLSRSSVVAPGLTWLRTSSSTSRTTLPARRIFSISSCDFSTTGTPDYPLSCNTAKHTNPAESACIRSSANRSPSTLFAQLLDGRNNSCRDRGDLPIRSHFGKTPQFPVVLDDGRSQCLVSAHALRKDFFRIIGSLGQCCAFYIAKTCPLRRV